MSGGGAGRRSRIWAIAVPTLLFVAGLVFAASATTAAGRDLRGGASGNLAEVIRRRSYEVERRARTVAALQADVAGLTRAAAPDSGELGRIASVLAGIEANAGLQPAEGPGLTVSLDDAPSSGGRRPAGVNVDDVVVHQQDVQAVVNALWAGGAEAMAIQDQRVVSTSAVRCVGNTLILQGRVYSPPYVVRAIGNVAGMRESLERDPQLRVYRQYVERVGLGYDVSELGSMRLPAFEGSVSLTYARRLAPPAAGEHPSTSGSTL